MEVLNQPLNPWPIFGLQLLTSSSILGFTSPTSLLRAAFLPLQITCTYLVHNNIAEYCSRNPWSSTITCFSAIFTLQYLEMAVLAKWSYEAGGPNSLPSSKKSKTKSGTGNGGRKVRHDTLTNRLYFGAHSLFSFRDLNTPHESQNSPLFSPTTPSRTTYLLHTIPKFLATYLLLDIIESQPPPPNPATLFSPAKVPLISRWQDVTAEEMAVRIGASTGMWIMVWGMLNASAWGLGALCVGLGGEVRGWRPLFGSIGEAFTIRGFWGKFWHQGTRKQFSRPSNYFIDHLLPFSLPRIVSRYAKILMTFYISGFVHVLADTTLGIPWKESGTIRFFVVQAGGIVVEDFVGWCWRGVSGEKEGHPTSWWKKVVGFVWVGVFMIWSTPAWFYAGASKATGGVEGKLLPFSVLGYFMPM